MSIKTTKQMIAKNIINSFKRVGTLLSGLRCRTTLVLHNRLVERVGWYSRWHQRRHHKKLHWGFAALYTAILLVFFLCSIGIVRAADFTDNWNFATIANFLFDSGIEQNGSSVRLKAQNYTADTNTKGLYHFDESSGNTATDVSGNGGNLTLTGSPSFVSGNLNNALSLNGSSQFASAVDSSALSVVGQLSLESWIKPSSPFNNNSDFSQMIIDKGSYRLGLDRTSGKAFFEIENNNSSQWTKRLGDGQSGSWTFNHGAIWSSVAYGSDIYVGLGSGTGDAEVWRWNGSAWTMVGGDAMRSSWPDQTYEGVRSLAVNGTALYAGLGDTTGDAEIWTCDLAQSCVTWTKIGGDGIGGGPAANTYSLVESMAVYNGSLYVGMTGGTAGNGDLFRYNGNSSWTQVAGDGLNGSWAASTFEGVTALYSDGSNLYAGLGTSTLDADLWRYNGSTWTQIGGDGVNLGGGASWNTSFESVRSINALNGSLYVGLGDGASDAVLWRLSGTTWSQIGGGGVNSSWNSTIFTRVYSIVNDGTNVYAALGSSSGSGEVWRWNGSAWTRIGGGATNSSTGWTAGLVGSLVWANSKLYAFPSQASGYGAGSYEWNGSAWNLIGGWYVNNSWGSSTINKVNSSTVHNGKLYYGLNGNSNSAYVYEYDGSTARLIGGSSLNSSWPAWTYEAVVSMTSYKGNLYVGLGTDAGDGEVWKWDGTTWTKVGGDGVNSSWATSAAVSAMTVFNGKLYAGLGTTSIGNTNLYSYDGSTWTLVKSSWSPTITNIQALIVWNGQLCVSGGWSAAGGHIFCGDGANSWTQIAGGGVNGSWATATNATITMAVYRGQLIAAYSEGNNSSTLYATVWSYNGSSWTQIAGNSQSGSWADGDYKLVSSVAVYNGQLYVGTGSLSSSTTAGDVWRYDGSAWTQAGGDGIENSWTLGAAIEEVDTLTAYKGKLYAGLGRSASADALVYSVGNNGYAETSTTSFGTSWQHLAATYDGVTMKLYVNGVLDGSSTVAATGVDNALPLLIGTGYGSGALNEGQSNFAGQIDEVRISNTARSSFTTLPYSNSEQAVTPVSAIRTSGVGSWAGFSASTTLNGGSVNFRLSDDDGVSWKYWSGSAWVASDGLAQASSETTINTHIGSFPVTFSGIKWQAILKGDGTQQVAINSVAITSNADSDAPNPNATSLRAYTNESGTEISDASWTSDADPYFSWTAANDTGAGLYGYCLYLGQTQSADPITSKGLLGTSPVSTAGKCQYVVAGTSLDASVAGVLATALSTSNSPYYLNIKALDKAGNLAASSAQLSFKFDNTAPTNPTYVTAPAQFSANKEATLTWPTDGVDGAADGQSGVAGLQYRIGAGGTWRGDGIDGSGLLANDGSYTTRSDIDFADINEGNNVFYFRAVDNAGNVSPGFVTATLKINTGAPSSPQSLVVSPATNTANSFAFSWTQPSSFAGDASALTYCYTINTLPTANTCTFTAAGVTSLSAGAYATQPGENTFYVVAKDNNINYATAASVTFTANTSAPGIPLDVEIADISNRATETWKLALSWNSPTSVGAGVSTYRIYRSTDNVNFSQVASTAGTSYVDSSLSQVQYYYKVKACDSANNCGALSSEVDQTPTGRYTAPANQTAKPVVSNITTKRATIAWSTDRGSDSRIAIGKKPGQYAPAEFAQSGQVTDHRIELNNLEAGTRYFFVAKWTDEDGNIGLSDEGTFETAPAPVVKQVKTSKIGLNSAIVSFGSFGAVQARVNFGRTDSFGGLKSLNTSASESTYNVELEGLDDGTQYFYQVTLLDNEGGEYKGDIYSFTTPQRPRISDLRFEPVKGAPTSTQRITWVTNVDTNASVTYGKEGSAGTDILNSALRRDHEIVIRGLSDDSVYFLIAQSRDANGNLAISDRQTFRTALDTRPPKISDLSIETSVKGTGSDARGQIVVTWSTDEPSTSQVAFGEGGGSNVTSLSTEDANLTTEHIVIISDLSPAQVYNIQAVSRDSARNESRSETESAIISRATDSILSIIVNVLQQIFGIGAK